MSDKPITASEIVAREIEYKAEHPPRRSLSDRFLDAAIADARAVIERYTGLPTTLTEITL